ncbi:MAG: ABC transporter substrate-binding protein, partial [bacterium]
VVVLNPRTTEMTLEARVFTETFEGGGGRILQRITYTPGSTTFEEHFEEVTRLEPQGLVLLLPPEDVELVGPQVAFYEVDEMEITILGSEAWSSQSVLEQVDARHTEGVLTVTSRADPESFGPRWDRFVDAYEEQFQRTLRSPMPALGYDAALLLLHAAREGDGSPEATARALEEIRGFEGATGVLDVVDGRIQRSYQPVRIENRRPVPYRP